MTTMNTMIKDKQAVRINQSIALSKHERDRSTPTSPGGAEREGAFKLRGVSFFRRELTSAPVSGAGQAKQSTSPTPRCSSFTCVSIHRAADSTQQAWPHAATAASAPPSAQQKRRASKQTSQGSASRP